MAKSLKLAGALAKDPKLNRVSPGVYRNAQGGLVNSRGGALPGQRPQQPQRPLQQWPGRFQPANPSQYQPANPSQYLNGQQQPNMGNALAGATQGANQFQPQQPMQPATRPPMPYGQGQEPGMQYAGGSANYDETTGQYRNGFNPMPKPDFSQFGPIQFQRQNQGLQQQYDTGFGDYLRSRAAQMSPAQQNMQPQQMPATGIVAPREPIAPQGQMSPAELQAIQNGTFKGYNY